MFGWGNDNRTPTEKTRDALTSTKKTKIKSLIGKCEACNKRFDNSNLDVHHISEASTADGSSDKNTPGNLVVLCPTCHRLAHNGEITKTTLKRKVSSRSDRIKKELRAILKDRPIVVDDAAYGVPNIGNQSSFINNPPPIFGGNPFGGDDPAPKRKTKKASTAPKKKKSSKPDDDIGSVLFGGKSPSFMKGSNFFSEESATPRRKKTTTTTTKKRKPPRENNDWIIRF